MKKQKNKKYIVNKFRGDEIIEYEVKAKNINEARKEVLGIEDFEIIEKK